MINSVLNLHATISTSKVELLLSEAIAQNLKDTKVDFNGMEINIHMNGKITLRGDQNVVTYQLPLYIHVLRPSGLFTVEGQGKVSMTFQSEFTFDKSLNLHAKSELIDHKWTEKPELKLGSLSMSAEALINMIINHTESILIGKIDKALEEKLSLKNFLEKQFYALVKNNGFVARFGLGADINLEELDFNRVKIDDQDLTVFGQLIGDIGLGNQITNLVLPHITFNQNHREDPSFRGKMAMTYPQIISIINNYTRNLEVGGKQLDFIVKNINYDGRLRIDATIEQPAKMDVEISGEPIYREFELLDFENMDFIIKPKSMIYKLFVPVIKGILESRMEEYLPIKLNRFFNSKSSPTIQELNDFKLEMAWEKISVDKIEFNSEGIIIGISAKELSLSLSS